MQLVNLRVSHDTMKMELDSYRCKCTLQSAETGWKSRTNPLQGSVAIRIFKCDFPCLWRENGAGIYVLL